MLPYSTLGHALAAQQLDLYCVIVQLLDLYCVTWVQGLDVMPMISPTAAENRPSLGQPTRLRLTGRTKLSGRLSAQPHHSDSATQLPASAFEGQRQS